MSAIQIVDRLLRADAKVTNSVHIATAGQKQLPPFIIISHVHEMQEIVVAGAVREYVARVSVAIFTSDAIECDRQAEAVKDCLGFVAHQTVGSGTKAWRDVSIMKAGNDTLDYNDDRNAYRRTIDYYVRWRT